MKSLSNIFNFARSKRAQHTCTTTHGTSLSVLQCEYHNFVWAHVFKSNRYKEIGLRRMTDWWPTDGCPNIKPNPTPHHSVGAFTVGSATFQVFQTNKWGVGYQTPQERVCIRPDFTPALPDRHETRRLQTVNK